jgi:hypothetical protein
MFLQLSSRDATLYVYKKTIFEINGEQKNTCEPLKLINDQIAIINGYINIYKTLVYKIIQSDKNNIDKNLYIETFEKICKKINKTNLNNENVVLLNSIIDKLYFIIDDNTDYFFDIVQEFTKKMKTIHFKKYEKKMFNKEMTEELNEKPDKFVSWLLS